MEKKKNKHGEEGDCCSVEKKQKRKTEEHLLVSNSFLKPCSIQSKTECHEKLFLCYSVPGSSNIAWYMINPSIKTTTLTPICTGAIADVGVGCGTAALGSKIYMIGGDTIRKYRGSSDVFYFDTSDNTSNSFLVQKQISAPAMLANRCAPSVVAAHGKLYVFGSNFCGTPTPWAEVFDPNLNLWSPLPEPPTELIQTSGCSYHALVGHKIVLCMFFIVTKFFAFDLKTGLWDKTAPMPLCDGTQINLKGPTLDDVLFTYLLGSVVAYDLANDKWFEKPVQGLGLVSSSVMPQRHLTYGHVMLLGNNTLCVVWEDEIKSCPYVHWVKFRVARSGDSKGHSVLRAHVLSRSEAPYCNPPGGLFSDCIAM